MNNHHYCVILAGGKGRRLWPCSREKMPKQFIDFFGTNTTLLQQTYRRMANFIPPENIYVSTNIVYENLVREQLPDITPQNVLAEPIHRNTAPSVAWAVHRILRYDDNADILVTPSDQAVSKEDVFIDNMLTGLHFVAQNDALLTMGVTPTRPEPGYGYIQLGEPTAVPHLFKVKTFTEKPDRNFAEMFMKSGEFYWNTGLFLANARYLRSCFHNVLPPVLSTLDEQNPHNTVEEENTYMHDNFCVYPNLSIDYGILEKSENVYVLKCNFGWADIGTWHGIYEMMSKSGEDNVVIDSEAILEDSHNNIVKLPHGKLAVINGLDGYIVAEKGNVLIICKKEDSSALIRKYVNEAQLKLGDDFV